ncbi:hypothetical protein J6590_075688 [Homalodisca vitripennis]|nr:hypothetical protein J6590_075688 [Homalodisca vitripennis]
MSSFQPIALLSQPSRLRSIKPLIVRESNGNELWRSVMPNQDEPWAIPSPPPTTTEEPTRPSNHDYLLGGSAR